ILITVKAISNSRYSQNKTWVRRVRLDLATQLADIDMQIMCFGAIASSPDLRKQHLAGHDLTTVLNKSFQQVIFSWGQLDLLAVHLHQSLCEINFQWSSYKSRLCTCFHLGSVT